MRSFLASAITLILASTSLARADDAMPVSDAGDSVTLHQFIYDGDAIADISGGHRRGDAYIGAMQYRGTYDLERLFGWQDTSLFFRAVWVHGRSPDGLVGNAQSVSALDAPNGATVQELWLQRNFNQDFTSLLVGLYDLNSEFDHTDTAGLFRNSSFGIGPEFAQSGLGGPSIYPRTSVGARIAQSVTDDVVLRFAALDGVPCRRSDGSFAAFQSGDGALLVGEAAYQLSDPDEDGDKTAVTASRTNDAPNHYTKLALGTWHYTTTLRRIEDQFRKDGTSGLYALAERRLIGGRGSDSSVSGFIQYGLAQPSVNRFGRYIGAGLVQTGLFGRANDQLGLSFAEAANGSGYIELHRHDPMMALRERVFELTYSAQMRAWLTLQPDVQYVIRPDTNRANRNALVLGIHFTVTVP